MDTLLQFWQSVSGMAQKGSSGLDMPQLLALAAALGWAMAEMDCQNWRRVSMRARTAVI